MLLYVLFLQSSKIGQRIKNIAWSQLITKSDVPSYDDKWQMTKYFYCQKEIYI